MEGALTYAAIPSLCLVRPFEVVALQGRTELGHVGEGLCVTAERLRQREGDQPGACP